MSQYVDFFIRSNSDEFLHIGCFTSSSKVYQAFRMYAPWEKIRAIKSEKLENILYALDDEKHRLQTNIDDYQQEIKFLTQLQAPIDDILERRFDILKSIKEVQEEIEEVDAAAGYVRALSWMLDAVHYADVSGHDENTYLYVGIEVGRPTVEDIVNA